MGSPESRGGAAPASPQSPTLGMPEAKSRGEAGGKPGDQAGGETVRETVCEPGGELGGEAGGEVNRIRVGKK